MKPLAKLAFGALAMATAALGTATPASAQVSFGFSFGNGPAYYDPCDRPYYARPPYCRYPRYYGRVYIGDRWYDGPFHYRDYRGHRHYWHGGRWHRGDIYGPRRNWRDRDWRDRRRWR